MGNRDDSCDRCGQRLDGCTCPQQRDADALAEALGRGSRWPEQASILGRPVLVAGWRAYMRRDGDRWAIEFEDVTLGTVWFDGLPSEALRQADAHVRQHEGLSLRRAWG